MYALFAGLHKLMGEVTKLAIQWRTAKGVVKQGLGLKGGKNADDADQEYARMLGIWKAMKNR